MQIADGLDKAHRKGIVHRDLNPGNVMLTKSGATRLDCGLAKQASPAVSAPAAIGPESSLEVNTLTAQGTVMGTPHYMAPEQLKGKEADARTDIFSFGTMLYETLTR